MNKEQEALFIPSARLRDMAEQMKDPSVKIISFDVFDTLLLRPFMRNEDLFELLDHEFSKLNPSQISFKKLRMEAEASLRRSLAAKRKADPDGFLQEDVTLGDIYRELGSLFGLPDETCETLMKTEEQLEYSLSMGRKSGRYLYEQALSTGKPVIVISDMYLSSDAIRNMLGKHGMNQFHKVYVSSEIGFLKVTGNLFRFCLKDLQTKAEELLHIGDNEQSDIKIAGDLGIRTGLLPKTLDIFRKHGCAHQVEKICADLTNWEAAKSSVGIGSAGALAAHLYFDDPFRAFADESDYNADPYFVGYAALGPEVLALVKWISDQTKRDQVKQIIFMARDGYLPMQVYEIYRKLHPGLPECSYLPVSRRAVLPAMFTTPQDFYDLPVDLNYQTPRKLLRLLSFCDSLADFPESCGSPESEKMKETCLGFDMDRTLSRTEFMNFMSSFLKERYDRTKHESSIGRIASFLKEASGVDFRETSALFDMGYSGRIPAALISASGCLPKVYYFHTDAREHFRYERRSGMQIRSFFDFNPYMESSLREYSYLEPAASCIGYDEGLRPLYDIGPAPGYSRAAIAMQQGALDFVRDFLKFFGEYEEEVDFRYHDAAMPFEAFIRYCSPYDRKIYENVLIDDELWGGRRDIELKYLMESRMRKIPVYAKREE